jgi:thiol-disulfide isomerase/thioredoxin
MKFVKIFSYFFIIVSMLSCNDNKVKTELKSGIWRGEILAQNNTIPFNFEVSKNGDNYKINLINGGESLEIDEIIISKDSIFFNMHIFDSSIKAKINDTLLTGIYTKNYADDYTLKFKAEYGKNNRFDNLISNGEFDGTWETTFFPEEGDSYPAVGIFKTENNSLKGTFLTKVGDYRYLDGYTNNDTLNLFTFDGTHIFKFKAYKENDTLLKGEFWSGENWHETFIAKKNKNAKLPNANEITYLKEGFNSIDFSFPGLDGNPVTLQDEKYKNKIIILQILGTWCPNCMDETRFYADWYRKNKSKGIEIIGLAYENKPDFEYAKNRVEIMKEKMNIDYDFVIAGTSTIKSVSESLPMLANVISFPTSIIIDKKGKVRRIHTGFSGPATGVYYEKFVDDFNTFIKELLEEE